MHGAVAPLGGESGRTGRIGRTRSPPATRTPVIRMPRVSLSSF